MQSENNGVTNHATLAVKELYTQRELVLENLKKVEGVFNVRENSDGTTLQVDFDPTRIDPSQLTNLLAQAGLSVQRVNSPTPSFN